MGPRPCLYGSAVEPRRLCLVGWLPRIAVSAAERCLGRHLRAELRDRAGRQPASPVRDAFAAAFVAAAAGHAGPGSGGADPGARYGRRGAAAAIADGLDRDLAEDRAALDPADAQMGPWRGRGQFPAPDPTEQQRRPASARRDFVA